jgi:TolB-like protein
MAPQAPPTASEIQAALDHALRSEPLRTAAQQRRFLTYVVEEAVAGRSEQLKEWSIARGALDRPTTFDPRSDPLVRVLAGRVRTSLARYYDGDGAAAPLRIDVPKGSYAPRFDWLGAEPHDDRPLTVGPIVAVTMLRDLSPEEHPGYLAAGFSESLVAALARYDGIAVVGPLAAGPPDAGVDDLSARAHAVGADLALSGTLRSSGDTLRVAVRLIEAASGASRWSATFEDRTSPDHPFDAEDRIAEQVSAQVADPLGVVHLARPAVGSTSDASVHRAMLAYYAYGRTLDQAMEPDVVAGLEASLRDEPDNALVCAMLAATTMFGGVGDAGGRPPSPELLDRARALARRSDQLAPANALASLVLAFDRLLDGDPDGARSRLERILGTSSHSPTFRSMCGIGLLLSGSWDLGISHLREALELNPNHPTWQHGFLSLDALAAGDPSTALEEARRVDAPGLVWGPLLRAAAHGALGELDAGLAELAQLDADALAAAADQDRFFSHTRLPPEVSEALGAALTPLLIPG